MYMHIGTGWNINKHMRIKQHTPEQPMDQRRNERIKKYLDPAIQFLRICPKECKSGDNRGTDTPIFTAVFLTIAKL
jgi:hypothetical protein